MGSMTPTSDVFFTSSRNVAISSGGEASSFEKLGANHVATSDRFGLVFLASNKELKCTKVSAIQKEDNPDSRHPDVTNHLFVTVPIGGLISGVFLSADNLLLAVCAEKANLLFCHLFDVRAFAPRDAPPGHNSGASIGPIYSFPLSNSPGTELTDFSFNPVIVEMFAVITTDGVVINYEIDYQNPPTLKIHGRVAIGATCCSWSPKGKQLVVGKADGSLVQLKPTMVEAKTIPPPTLAGRSGPYSAKAVYWSASTVFLVAQWCGSSSLLVVTTVQKGQPTSYVEFVDVCLQNLDEERFSRTFFCPIPKWNIVVALCRNSTEVAVFQHSEDRLQWAALDLENGRASLPFVNRSDTFPIGAQICCASTFVIEKANNPQRPPSPLLIILNTRGVIVPFHLVNLKAPSATYAPEELKLDGLRQMLQPLAQATFAPVQPPQQQPVQSATTQAAPKTTNFFEQTAGPQGSTSTDTPRAPVNFAATSKLKVNLLKQFDAVEVPCKPQLGMVNHQDKSNPNQVNVNKSQETNASANSSE